MATVKPLSGISNYLPFDDPAVRFFLAALVAAGGLVLGLLATLGFASLKWVAALAIVMLASVRWSGSAIALFCVVTVTIFWSTQFVQPSFLSAGETVLGAAVLVYLGLHYRLLQAVQRARQAAPANDSTGQAPAASRLWGELTAIVAVAAASAMMARGGVWYLYIGRAMYRDFGMPALVAQLLFGLLVVGGLTLLLVAIVRSLSQRSWNRLEADMVLNEETYTLLHPDLRRLARRRRERQTHRVESAGTTQAASRDRPERP